ncbi:hypothetical protein [Janthinobacterium sp. PC23-8]|uniref:hypothetical protein n=1 Tax=Janthinobacterium sp. PC23-8 TaxID=2012679 RepID=UPI00114012CF|nr:hypothetical protein [Janthinobacterium sp. PC23-8]
METHTITWNGAIQLGHPISGTLAAVVALAIAAGLLAFAAFGSITQKARVGGLVVPTEGAVTVAAIQSGI